MIWKCSLAVLATVLIAGLTQAAPIIDSFDAPGADPATGWTVDRYAPAVFQDGVNAHGRVGVLHHQIRAVDHQANAFYNTQGRQLGLPDGTTAISIDLYIPANWADMPDVSSRYAGFWGIARNDSDAISAYPIIEYGQNNEFRIWDSSTGWIDIGNPSLPPSDEWVTLIIELDTINDVFNYTIGDLMASAPALGSAYLDGVILQGYNNTGGTSGVTYAIYWDGLNATVVPEPASLALWTVLGVLGAVWGVRTRPRAS